MQIAVDAENPSVHRIIKISLRNANLADRTEFIPEGIDVDYPTEVIRKMLTKRAK